MAMPRLSGAAWVMSAPSTRIAPAATGTKPEMARSRVVLPQPDEPSSATNSPARNVQRNAMQDPQRSIGDFEPIDFQRLGHAEGAPAGHADLTQDRRRT